MIQFCVDFYVDEDSVYDQLALDFTFGQITPEYFDKIILELDRSLEVELFETLREEVRKAVEAVGPPD